MAAKEREVTGRKQWPCIAAQGSRGPAPVAAAHGPRATGTARGAQVGVSLEPTRFMLVVAMDRVKERGLGAATPLQPAPHATARCAPALPAGDSGWSTQGNRGVWEPCTPWDSLQPKWQPWLVGRGRVVSPVLVQTLG